MPLQLTTGNRQPATALVIAHRGASGLAPENTMAAFRLAAALGADGFELDVQLEIVLLGVGLKIGAWLGVDVDAINYFPTVETIRLAQMPTR